MAEPTKPPTPAVTTQTKQGDAPIVPPQVSSMTEGDIALSLDPTSLDADKHYRWVRAQGPRVTRMIAKGYRFVGDNEVRQLIDNPDSRADGRVYNADTVLMAITRERHSENRRKIAERTRSQLSTPKGQFKRKASEVAKKTGKAVDITDKE